MDLGSGDAAFFGGAYADPDVGTTTATSYMKLQIQGMKIGIITLPFYPPSAALVWARSIHDASPDYQWWVTTHGYMDMTGAQCARVSTYGPATYSLADAPLSNSGQQMWGGSDATWSGFKTWPNLTGVFCGHWVDGYTSGWVWQKRTDVSTSARGQTVQQIFCDCQGNSVTGGTGDTATFCGGGSPNGTTDVMHLMLLRIDPATQLMESFLVSTNSGKYTGAAGVLNSVSPIQLFNVSMPQPPAAPVTASHVLIG
jgi:hypothetical protein